MFEQSLLLEIYCLVIFLISITGGLFPVVVKLSHKQLQLCLSFVAGVILGLAILHLLPHAFSVRGVETEELSLCLLFGLISMFVLERFCSFHHHESNDDGCTHSPAHQLTWGSVGIGLGVHGILSGIALAANYHIEEMNHALAGLSGIATFLAIILHKPFESLTIMTLISRSNYTLRTKLVVNILFALIVPIGVLLFYWGFANFYSDHVFVAKTLAFSCGVFLFIGLSDILPELQFHKHDRLLLTFSFLLGIFLIWYAEKLAHLH